MRASSSVFRKAAVSLNVLITAGSRRVALVQAFQRALRSTGGGTVTVTDVNPLSPTVYVADRSYRVPLSTEPSYIAALAGICRTDRIGLLVPTIDDELTLVGQHVDVFTPLGTSVAVSPPDVTSACNDKLLTHELLASRGVPSAATWTRSNLPVPAKFPLFVKPRFGRGGVGAFSARNQRELDFFLDYVSDPVVQPFLDGPEFTIDVLCDLKTGEPLAVVPRERVVIRAGVVDRGRTVRDGRLMKLGLLCARALRFAGAINIQCRIVDGRPIIFEINPRFSGGIPLTIAAGADFPQMLVQLARGERVTPIVGRFQDGLWMTSYESSVFLPESSVGFLPGPALQSVTEVA
jgi:carbamoyl-phosphate synthase large subunit